MPLTGEYERALAAWARKQAELYEATDVGGWRLRGRPVIVLTAIGVSRQAQEDRPSCA